MAVETEIKLRLVDPQAVRVRLRAVGARFVGRVLEVNRLLDDGQRSLFRAGCGLRLRRQTPLDGANRSEAGPSDSAELLTYKGPQQSAAPSKQREEIETRVDDGAALLRVFERLGYRESVVFEKRRETWRLESALVTLDELPELGWFVEIEGPTAAAIAALQAQLDLADAQVVHDTYVGLVARRVRPDEQGCYRLKFG